jgi:hypothetical protein
MNHFEDEDENEKEDKATPGRKNAKGKMNHSQPCRES